MKPAFLFVHGFGCDRENWGPQIEALSATFEVITLDLPGHGRSPLPEIHNLSSLASAVVDVKEACGRPLILVGHSMGCRIVLESLRLSPSGVVGVAFLDGSAIGREHAARLLQLLADRLRTHGLRASMQANVEQMFTPESPAALREAAVVTALRLDPVFAENILMDMARWDAVEALEPLAASGMPVLAIQSTTLDANMRRRSLQVGETSPWGDLVRKSIADARIRNVAGVGHFVHLDASEVVNDELATFGQRLSIDDSSGATNALNRWGG